MIHSEESFLDINISIPIPSSILYRAPKTRPIQFLRSGYQSRHCNLLSW